MKEEERSQNVDHDFDEIVEEWEVLMVPTEVEIEIDRDDEILAPPVPILNGSKGMEKKKVDLDFDSLPEVWKPFVRCHHHQRERLEDIARKWKWHYYQLMERCSKVIGKKVRDSGEMSFSEAERCIERLE